MTRLVCKYLRQRRARLLGIDRRTPMGLLIRYKKLTRRGGLVYSTGKISSRDVVMGRILPWVVLSLILFGQIAACQSTVWAELQHGDCCQDSFSSCHQESLSSCCGEKATQDVRLVLVRHAPSYGFFVAFPPCFGEPSPSHSHFFHSATNRILSSPSRFLLTETFLL